MPFVARPLPLIPLTVWPLPLMPFVARPLPLIPLTVWPLPLMPLVASPLPLIPLTVWPLPLIPLASTRPPEPGWMPITCTVLPTAAETAPDAIAGVKSTANPLTCA